MFRFVSLGSDRQTAAQIAGLKYTPNIDFFDVLTVPIRLVIELVENEFRGLLQPENLLPVYVDDGLVGVLDVHYRIEFIYDFTTFSPQETDVVRARYEAKAIRFLELFQPDATPPYFVRRWHPRDGVEDETEPMRFFEMLRERRRDVRMLYLHRDPARPEFISGNYRSAYLPPPAVPDWTGNTEVWRYMLDDFAVRGDGNRHGAASREKQRPRFAIR